MRLLRELTTSFAGGVNDSAAADEYLPNQAQVLINARPSLLGNAAAWIKPFRELSYAQNWQAFDDSTCFGAIEFYTSAGVQQIVAFFDDAAFYSLDGGRTFTAISGATGLREDHWSLVVINEGGTPKLCCANGGSASYQWDGATWSAISNIASGTKFLAVHGNRLIGSGYSGAQVAASKVGDIDMWAAPDGWVVNADDGSDGDDVTAIYTLGGVVLVFKRSSFGYIEGYGYQTLQVAAGARGVSRSVGCTAHRSIAPVGENAIVFLSEQGFVYYALGGAPQIISGHQQRFVAKIDRETIRQYPGAPSAMWVPDTQEYWCALPVARGPQNSVGNVKNTWIYVWRPGNQQRPPAAYMIHPTDDEDSTLVIDANGMLDVESADRTNYMGFVNEHGMLDLCKLPDVGLWMEVDPNGMLDFSLPQHLPASLFTADRGNRTKAPHAGTHVNGIIAFEEPSVEPLSARNMVRNGDFGSSAQWSLTSATISGGALDGNEITGAIGKQFMPLVVGRTYRLIATLEAATQGELAIRLGDTGAGLTAPQSAQVYVLEHEVTSITSNGPVLQFQFAGVSAWDGNVLDVELYDITEDSDPAGDPLAIIRTRPLTYGDEFTRKKAKRVSVVASQPLAHTAKAYALTDLAYGTEHDLAFTAADAGQEQKARVGGKGRVIQGEVHLSAECIIDGIEVIAQPLGDQT